MASWNPLLQSHGHEIAAFMADSSDAPHAAPALANLLEGIALSPDAAPATSESLRSLGLDDATIARLVRGMLFHSIELIREEAEPPEVREGVLTLREYLRGAIPLPAVNPAEREYFRKLMFNEVILDEPEYLRLQDLIHNVTRSLNDIIYIHDLNGMFLYISRPGLELTRFTADDLLAGLSIYDLIAPEFLEMMESRMEMPGANPRTPYSAEIYTRDGMRIAIELSTRVLRRKGRDPVVIGLARDLRLARRLESEIRRANAHLDALLAHAPLAVFTLDAAGVVQDVNPAGVQLFGAPSAAGIVGEDFLSLLVEPPEELHRKLRLAAGGLEVQCRVTCETMFGGTLTCDASVVPTSDCEGEPEALLLMLNDVSVQTTLRQNIMQREKLTALGEVMAGVAHQISNPLTVIMGYAQTLLEGKEGTEKRRLEHIMNEADRCRQVMQNLVRFATPRAVGKSYFNLNDLLEQVISLREYHMSNAGIKIRKHYDLDLPPVYGDENELQRAFLNVIMNSDQALALVNDREKTLEISTTMDAARRIVATFKDNGPGMSEAIQMRVFDPFFTTKGGTSAGLGLSTARQIVREHGGEIRIQSIEGEGTQLTIVIPGRAAEKAIN